MLADHPAESTTESEPSDASCPHETTRGRQPKHLQFVVQFGPGYARLYSRRASRWIRVNTFHRREVDYHTSVTQADSHHVVSGSFDRGVNAVLSREFDCRNHIGHSGASRNHCRMLVDHGVVKCSRFV